MPKSSSNSCDLVANLIMHYIQEMIPNLLVKDIVVQEPAWSATAYSISDIESKI